ncbi:MAG: enolase C-terminal domain-like protein [Planctomycetia bacterium]|nr:enolase C-terminal domain-like protein [Planctomycetia bacterium]
MKQEELVITKVAAYVTEMRLGFSYASGTQDMARGIVWEIVTPSGVGFGECAFFGVVPQPDGGEDPGGELRERLSAWASPLLGADATGLETLLAPLPKESSWPLRALREGLSIGLYDLVGKAYGMPLHVMLGGRRRTSAPGMPVVHVTPVDVMVRRSRKWLEGGYRYLKIKFRGDVDADVAAISAIRDLAGPDVGIVVDANLGYSELDDAVAAIGALKPFDVYYFEDLLDAPLEQFAELRRRTGAKVMVDGQAYWPNIHNVIKAEAADVINHHPNNQGGLGTALKISAVAAAAGLETAIGACGLHGVQNAAFQILSSVIAPTRPCEDIGLLPYYSGPTRGEYDFDKDPNILREPVPVVNGTIQIPDGPGLGVEVDRKKLETAAKEMVVFE